MPGFGARNRDVFSEEVSLEQALGIMGMVWRVQGKRKATVRVAGSSAKTQELLGLERPGFQPWLHLLLAA